MNETIRKQAQTALSLLEKYSLDCGDLRRELENSTHFRLTVPFIGSFNAGKSALLNALLGAPLLPEGITATTRIPTELCFGDSAGWALRDGHPHRLGMGELRDGMDLSGVTLLHAECPLPFLRGIPSLLLVDTPGLGAGPVSRERALRAYLPPKCACLLVFSAEDPVIRESEAVFLRELRLRDAPVYAVLTKCDKLVPSELALARAFLEQSLDALLGGKTVRAVCVSARGDVQAAKDLLLSLQERAEGIALEQLEAALQAACLPLRDYLCLRIESARLPVPEAEGRAAVLDAQERLLAEPLAAEAGQFEAKAADWEQRLAGRLDRTVRDAAPCVETMLLSDQNPADYLDGALRAVIADSLHGDLEPLGREYLKSVSALLRLPVFADSEQPQEELAPLAPAALTAAPDSEELFARLLGLLHESPRRLRTQLLRGDLAERTLPELLQRFTEFARREGHAALDAVRQAAEQSVARRTSARQAARQILLEQRQPDDERRGVRIEELAADLQAVDAILRAGAAEGGDAHGTDL